MGEASMGHARGSLDRDERVVKDGILRMGSLVEAQIRGSIRAIAERDVAAADTVVAGDVAVNAAQREIVDAITMTIATQQPVARDLRFLLALDHVASELERIGDHAVSVAKQARRLAEDGPLPGLVELSRMGATAADLVRGILEALVSVDEQAAREVAGRDDEIDHGYKRLFGELIEAMRADPAAVEPGTRLILAAHWVERIGDRVTNVAEDVVYLSTGEVEDLN